MQYIDSGLRNPEEALGSWLNDQLNCEVTEIRIQSGFFSVDGLAPFVDTFKQLKVNNWPTLILIGSNDGNTLKSHVAQLISFLGLPREKAKLGVVRFSGSFFHPKVYHIRRKDGSQAAYVGSANLTMPGISALHVEAGIILDSREGDPHSVLNKIAEGVEFWFKEKPSGLEIIADPKDINKLESLGILSSSPPEIKASNAGNTSGKKSKFTSLKPLFPFKSIEKPKPATKKDKTQSTKKSKQKVVAKDPKTVGDEAVLIAEIPKSSSRWKQANFDLNTFTTFFQVELGKIQSVFLFNVLENGTIGPKETRPAVAVKSQNYRFELNAASGIPYPTTGRPVGIFLRTEPRTFKYLLLLPDNPKYKTISAYLEKTYSGYKHHVRRVTTDAKTLKAIWPQCPFWK